MRKQLSKLKLPKHVKEDSKKPLKNDIKKIRSSYDNSQHEVAVKTLSSNNFELAIRLVEEAQETQKMELTKGIVDLFNKYNKAVDFLEIVLIREIAAAPADHTLFRDNSLATRGMNYYMNTVGVSYLEKVLQSTLRSIVSSSKSCDMKPNDPSLEENVKTLKFWITKIWDSIKSSIEDCPPSIRHLFWVTKNAIMHKWNDELLSIKAINSFFFLRFINPTIVGPHHHGLTREPNDKAQTNLITISKMLQHIANLSDLYKKDSNMVLMRSYMSSRIPEMVTFINELAQDVQIPHKEVESSRSAYSIDSLMQRLRTCKVMIFGQGERALVDYVLQFAGTPEFDGVKVYQKSQVIQGKLYQMELCTAFESHLSILDQLLQCCHGYIITFDCHDKKSFDNLDDHFERIQRVRDVACLHSVPVILAGLRANEDRKIDIKDAQLKALKWGCEYVDIDLINGSNVEESFRLMVSKIEKHRNTELPGFGIATNSSVSKYVKSLFHRESGRINKEC